MSKYGFYDRLTKEFPSQVLVDLCQVCNYECIHCPQSQFKHSSVFSGAYLDFELNKKLVDEVKSYGKDMTQQIRYAAKTSPRQNASGLFFAYSFKIYQTISESV